MPFPEGVSKLPFIDAHETLVGAPPEVVWDAIARVAGEWGGRLGPVVARALGCSHTRSDFPRTVVGFRVFRADRPMLIALRGAHRFSQYELEFSAHPERNGTTRLCAKTWAAFPGVRGTLYRALVIGTGGHVAAVRGLLKAIKHRAEEHTTRCSCSDL